MVIEALDPAWLVALSTLVGACFAGIPTSIGALVVLYNARHSVKRDEMEILRGQLNDSDARLTKAEQRAETLRMRVGALEDELGVVERYVRQLEGLLAQAGIQIPTSIQRRRSDLPTPRREGIGDSDS